MILRCYQNLLAYPKEHFHLNLAWLGLFLLWIGSGSGMTSGEIQALR